MAERIEFYFDFSSPYSYFAHFTVDALATELGWTCDWKPMMIGAAFKASGNKPLIQQPIKGEYSAHDWKRLARLMNVPWVLPDPFPISTLAAARAFYWLADRDPVRAKELARACFIAYFGQGRDITTAETVADLAAPLGVSRHDLLAAVQDPAVKERVRQETDRAIERGVFGAPFFFVDGEPFFGNDRLGMVREWVKRGGW